jgi:hypothetical protein
MNKNAPHWKMFLTKSVCKNCATFVQVCAKKAHFVQKIKIKNYGKSNTYLYIKLNPDELRLR